MPVLPLIMDPPLKSLVALALDCQTTGASAARDDLLEIGWARVGPWPDNDRDDPVAFRVTLPEGVALSPGIAKLTGIQESDLETALPPDQVWRNLVDAFADLPAQRHRSGGLALIHYARFERPFLQRLHSRFGNGGSLPFQIICTHAIARRLLPHLPRCGLRALAGYFGFTLDARKRAACHALATRVIWEHLIPLLGAKDIQNWSALVDWLDCPRPPGRVLKKYPMPRALRLDAPDHPGVYRMRRSNGDLLYIGKARSLKGRINSYFQTRRRHGEHILEMLTQARDLDYSLTPTTLEAALLEADLIEKFVPPYNIMLKPPETEPVFCTVDFQAAGAPDRPELSVGPLPSERALAAFRFLVAHCGQTDPALPATMEDLAAVLDIPARYLPPRSVLAEGLDQLRESWGRRGDLALSGRQLLKRGVFLWRLYKNRAAFVDEGEAPVAATVSGDREWTLEDVGVLLDGIIRRGSHLVRRGRWFQILANTTLYWDAVEPRLAPGRILFIRQGQIRPGLQADAVGGWPKRPPGASTRMAVRSIFNFTTYTRLRVLTTELRRLLAEERRIRICPAVGGVIENRGLTRLLNLI